LGREEKKGGEGPPLFFFPSPKENLTVSRFFVPRPFDGIDADRFVTGTKKDQIFSSFQFFLKKKKKKRKREKLENGTANKRERRHISFASPLTTSSSLNSLFRVLCNFPSRYLFAIDLSLEYLALDGIYHPY